MPAELNAVECKSAVSEDGTLVQLIFRDDVGNESVIVLARQDLPALSAQIQARIRPGSITPIRPEQMRPGQTLAIQAHQIAPHEDGLMLRLFASLGDGDQNRGVTIPIPLNRSEAESLADDLRRYLSPSES